MIFGSLPHAFCHFDSVCFLNFVVAMGWSLPTGKIDVICDLTVIRAIASRN